MKIPAQIKLLLVCTLLVLAALGFNNCSKVDFKDDVAEKAFRAGETIVGNPMTAARSVLAKVCTLIANCHPEVTEIQCESAVLTQGGFDSQFGLPTQTVKNFSEIIQSEASGQLMANQLATRTCLGDIDKIQCSDPLAQAAYDSASKSFAGTAFLIPTMPGSCPAIFSQPKNLKEYHVTINGDDAGDGSADHPWATITHASQALTLGPEGTTVHVGPGNYSLPVTANCASNNASCGVQTSRSGTSQAPLTYISDETGAAKILAPGASAVWYNAGDYVRIVGFEIQGSGSANFGIFSEAAFGQMISNHIHDIPVTNGCATGHAGAGIFFGYITNAHDNDAIGNRIHDIGPRLANGLPKTAYCLGMANGLAYDQPRGRIQNNIIYATDSWGVVTSHLASDLQISHNLLFHNGNVTDSGTPTGGAIFISGETSVGVHDHSTVSNNIIRNNDGRGINEFISVGPNNLYLNNLMYANTKDFDLVSGATPSGTISSDPLMVSFALDGTGDYRLTALSPAINSGSSTCASPLMAGGCTPNTDFGGVQRPLGGALDIGPFEWHP